MQSVSVPVRLGEISSVISLDYKINRLSWPTFPSKLSSVVPVRLPVRLVNINCKITIDIRNRPSWPTRPCKLSSFVPVRLPVRLGIVNSDVRCK